MSFVHVLPECNVKNESIAGKSDEHPMKKGGTGICTIQQTERQMIRGKVGTIEKLTVDQRKEAI